jgi:NAD(P)-dependent dehydrogenase (short-subunit alcohol dehydrogenase family)
MAEQTTARAVVVTGVSTGIGLATARVLLRHGVHVFGSVRSSNDADRVRRELGDGLTPLVFDVTDPSGIAAGADVVRDALGDGTLFGLVNNAGIAVGGPLALQPIAEIRRTLEVNVPGAMAVTQAFLPLLGMDWSLAGPCGRIVNISSVAGRIGPPFLGAYAASKHALEGLSESLRRELLPFGIDVVIVGPGSVATPIWDKAEETDATPYMDSVYAEPLRRFLDFMVTRGRRGLPPEQIGDVVWTALTARRPRTRYAPVLGRVKNWFLPRMLPPRIVDRMIARQLGLLPGSRVES